LQQEADEPITIYINSPGGEINAGLMIYDAINACSVPVNVVCTGLCASMAAILLTGGNEGRRYILPHSNVMIHEPLIAGGLGGSATSIKNISESIQNTKEIINDILQKHTGRTKEEIEEATSFDNYMNAEEAIKFGLCDAIAETLEV
ncbi:MAG: ATP-dependent Clp protease proteolytic subunit, partial [Pseudobutyrivibrio sp.]|nr:ATP-dependent Clp protease proteolytic subunit [Pseudobutyrivibrio sp.]